jgi:amino acid transporter
MNTIGIFIVVFSIVAIATVFVVSQVFLSKRENKLWGLLLPVSLASMFVLIGVILVIFTPEIPVTLHMDPTITLTAEEEIIVANARESARDLRLQTIRFNITALFLLFNIPAALLFAIHVICKRKGNRFRELGRMRLQDL